MSLLRALLVSSMLLTTAVSAAAAPQGDPVDALAGRPVTSIRLEVEGRPTEATDLFALIEVRRGRPLDLAELRASLMQLHGAGRFDDIRVRGRVDGAGVALFFDLVPRHPVDRVSITGARGIAPGELERELQQQFVGGPRTAQADAAARAVERMLSERGYRQARVRPSLDTSHDPDRATLVLTVEMGPQTLVQSARVDGTSPLSEPDVLKRLGIAVGQPYRSRDIDTRLDALIDELRARGYYEASVSHARDVVSDDGRMADVVITIDAGATVRLKFAGDPLPGKDADLVPIAREGSIDDDLLEDSVRRIEAALRREGYWKGKATFTTETTNGAKTITFTVTRGLRYRFDRLEVTGQTALSTDAIALMIGLTRDAPFDESKVARGVAAMREAYLQRGYAAATITAAAIEVPPAKPDADPRIIERITVEEGRPTIVADVTVTGASRVSAADILGAMRLKRDGPYVAALLTGDREAVKDLYDARGYGAAQVDVRVRLDDTRTRATLQVDVQSEGPQTLLDHVIISGNRRVSEETIRAAVRIKAGEPLGTAARIEIQQRLSALGLFRRVQITEAPHDVGDPGTDLIITVDESPTTTVTYGGGLEAGLRARTVQGDSGELDTVDKFEMAPRASFEVSRTNLWGKNRSVNFNAGVSLRPKDAPGDPTQDGHCCGFSEYRVDGSFREPSLFGWNANGLASVAAEQAIRNSFTFSRQNGSLQMLRGRPTRASFIAGYSLERVRLYNVRIDAKDQLLVDRLFPQVRLSMFSTSVLRDTRTDPLSPGDGELLSADANLAMRAIGSQVGFAKVFLQSFAYRRLPNAPRVVLAAGARLGLVRGFLQTVNGEDVELVPASQRFFAGGSTTVRGFQQDRLGTPDLLDANGLSVGGNGLLVLNAEIRTAITREIGIATFLDTGNVFVHVSDMRLGDLRTSLGAGLRYKSPLGPLRLDFAWKLGGLRSTDSRRWEFHFSIGEAF